MSYDNDIPQPTDLISNSQADILGNFAAIDSGTTGTGIGFSRNHVTMTDAINGGLHSRVDYFQAVASPTISGFASSAYPKTVAVTTPSSSNIELCYKNAASDIQLTSSALVASSGEGFIPGGLQIRCGSGSSNGSGAVNNFSTPFPTACISATATGTNSALTTNILKITGKTKNSITITSPSGESVYYIAIGY